MVALLGGIIALLLGIIAIFGWWEAFIRLLQGAIPPILILGGALAAYLGAEEIKDKRRAEMEAAREPFTPAPEETDKYKKEVEELKAKLAAMDKEPAEAPEETKGD
ncbi:MAG: hypothetical protein KQJ78_17540 [Deltaproteobacteria bacterium]|nr:hypothetical protein [Deltaproteobacteria bacterium]